MKPHLRYLRYVLIHKLYVLRAGIAINGWRPGWLWRLLVHDLSKFSPAEWGPYVATFYGPKTTQPDVVNRRKYRFDCAWLHHQHANPHHWQHWLLKEDSGALRVLIPPAVVVDEMVADWLAAGQKVLGWPSLTACVAETITWYASRREKILLREVSRNRVEQILLALAQEHGLAGAALEIHAAREARASIVIPGR